MTLGASCEIVKATLERQCAPPPHRVFRGAASLEIQQLRMVACRPPPTPMPASRCSSIAARMHAWKQASGDGGLVCNRNLYTNHAVSNEEFLRRVPILDRSNENSLLHHDLLCVWCFLPPPSPAFPEPLTVSQTCDVKSFTHVERWAGRTDRQGGCRF